VPFARVGTMMRVAQDLRCLSAFWRRLMRFFLHFQRMLPRFFQALEPRFIVHTPMTAKGDRWVLVFKM